MFANKWIPSIQREHGMFIMSELAKYITSTKILRQLNRYRIYLKAITLSDIINSAGKALCKYALKEEEHQESFLTMNSPTKTTSIINTGVIGK